MASASLFSCWKRGLEPALAVGAGLAGQAGHPGLAPGHACCEIRKHPLSMTQETWLLRLYLKFPPLSLQPPLPHRSLGASRGKGSLLIFLLLVKTPWSQILLTPVWGFQPRETPLVIPPVMSRGQHLSLSPGRLEDALGSLHREKQWLTL